MGRRVEVRCRCGHVRGAGNDPSPRTVNRMVCNCNDCQAYTHQIGCADLLNDRGGSDSIQIAPAASRFTKGQDQIQGLRLAPNGLYRWYAKCCSTPVGNTRPPTLPFVSMLVQSFDAPQPDEVFGAPRGATFCKYAVGEPPADSTKLILLHLLLGRVLGWWLGGKTWPDPFFARETRAPIYPVSVVSHERREALRAL
jgi:hypothetical protein